MKRLIITVASSLAVALIAGSCNAFLEENFKTALSPKSYFKTEEQIVAGVNGLYTFVDDLFEGDVEVGTQNFIFLDYLPGYAVRPRSAGSIYLSQAMSLTVSEENTFIEKLWKSAYTAIENSNSVIAGIEASAVTMNAVTKDKLLGEAYFMRAYHYFNLVRLWGEVPLKTSVTSDLSDVKLPLATQEAVYERIERDLTRASELMAASPWTSTDGRVTRGAVYTLLAKVYLTMAGYPLQVNLGEEEMTAEDGGAFLSLSKGQIFTEERVQAVVNCNLYALEELDGERYVLGAEEGGPNVIFQKDSERDSGFAIVEIN